MKIKLFNSRFELALRILLILGQKESASLDQLLVFDFITTYASSFNLSKNNLHGDNAFNYSEIASRRSVLDKGISLLRMYNLLDINYSGRNGYEYHLTDLGYSIEAQLDDQYADDYRQVLSKVIGKYSRFSSKELMKLIDSNLMKELG
ncbi:ABC-three component system middle component 2 [Ligilactobacillus ubinensis]|uniref:ABC-three component system middle component 2 n=1 Tax=Ligilactobacillus ubinensis TaxID=2876789 RepID=UPI0031344931